VNAHSAREWSSEAATQAICPNSLSQHCCTSEETGGWLVEHMVLLEYLVSETADNKSVSINGSAMLHPLKRSGNHSSKLTTAESLKAHK